MKPTEEQLKDPKWWDENAPEGATHYHPTPPGLFYKHDHYWSFHDQCWVMSLSIAAGETTLQDLIRRPTTPPAPEWTKESQAVKTLESMGYTYLGGEYWKPPLGEKPDWIDWNGEGLPPVGFSDRDCELVGAEGFREGFEVVAHKVIAAIVWGPYGDDPEGQVETLLASHFRPLRTKEQRETDELAEFINAQRFVRGGFSAKPDVVAREILAWLKERPQ